MLLRLFLITILSFVCVSSFAEEVKEAPTLYVYTIRTQKCVELPHDANLEVDGQLVQLIEIREDFTLIVFKDNTLEVYTSQKPPKDNEKVTVKIERYQHGPGFTVPSRWKIAYGRNSLR